MVWRTFRFSATTTKVLVRATKVRLRYVDERPKILRRLREAASGRLDDLRAAMVEEYGGVV